MPENSSSILRAIELRKNSLTPASSHIQIPSIYRLQCTVYNNFFKRQVTYILFFTLVYGSFSCHKNRRNIQIKLEVSLWCWQLPASLIFAVRSVVCAQLGSMAPSAEHRPAVASTAHHQLHSVTEQCHRCRSSHRQEGVYRR